MKFLIRTTNGSCADTKQFFDDYRPCADAKSEEIPITLCSVCSSAREHDEHFKEKIGHGWLESGKNHHLNRRGHLIKTLGSEPGWTIEINTLDDLIAFMDKYQEPLVISRNDYHDEMPEIEIYNDYRE